MSTSYFCPYCGADNAPGETLCCACQQPLDAIIASRAASTLLNQRYAILTELGAGGFGAVYKARDTQQHDRLVAVKQINLQGLSPQEIIEATDAFNREAQILSTLSHPLLPRIFDQFHDPEHWYLVMNFIEGQTLDEYLQARPAHTGLPLNETLTTGLQLCDVLHYLHIQQPPVIFRDLKPGNIMRTSSGRLYLIDFGIARRFKPGQSKDTIPFGSPGFASPEQYGRAQTTPQADIYSLGALLYCLISGDDPSEHPFQFPPLRLYGIDGIRELDALIQRMVALDPAQRPANILEVRNELQRIQHLAKQVNKQQIWIPPQGQTPPPADAFTGAGQQHIFATPSSAQIPARKTSRRSVVTAGLVIGGALLVGGLAVFAGNNRTQIISPQPSDPNQVDYSATATADAPSGEATPTTTGQMAAIPLNGPTSWSPNLSHAAVFNTNTNQLELYRVKGQQLLGTIQSSAASSYSTIQWSPDNKQIIIDSSEVWDVNSRRKLFTLPASLINNAIVWSPNGNYLAIGYSDPSDNAVFALLSATDGTQLFQQNFSVQAATSLAWSPDSRYIILPDARFSNSEINGTWVLEIWNSQTYQKIRTLSDPNASDLDPSFYTISAISWSPDNHHIALVFGFTTWLWDLTNTDSIHKLASFPQYYYSISQGPTWSPDEKYLAMLTDQGMSIWDVSSGQTLQLNGNGSQDNLVAFAWSADSKSITTADGNNVLAQWTVG